MAATEEAILTVYRDTLDDLYARTSRRCGGDRELTEDVVQETWLRAVATWRTQGMPDRPLAWLTTVSRNLLLNRLRRQAPIPLDDVAVGDLLVATDVGVTGDAADAIVAINEALGRLPAKQSQLLESFHFDRCTVAEIATACGISQRAVEGRLRRARQSLRSTLESMGHAQGELR